MHENVTKSVKVNAPVEKVWKALTNKEDMKKWYFDIPDFELKEGNLFNFYEPGTEGKYHHHCEILEVIPNQKFKHTWSYPDFSKDKTILKWELQPDGDSTVVNLTHKGLENFSHLGKDFQKESFTAGWDEILNKSLKEFVEN